MNLTKKVLKVKLKQNRALFFPSMFEHSVNPVKMHTEPKDSGYGRYEIPYGAGASGTPKEAKDFVGIKFIAEGDELRIFALDASGNGSLLADGVSSTNKLKSTKLYIA